MAQAWLFIGIAIAVGLLAWVVGSRHYRGRNFALGFFLSLIGVLMAVILKSSDDRRVAARTASVNADDGKVVSQDPAA